MCGHRGNRRVCLGCPHLALPSCLLSRQLHYPCSVVGTCDSASLESERMVEWYDIPNLALDLVPESSQKAGRETSQKPTRGFPFFPYLRPCSPSGRRPPRT